MNKKQKLLTIGEMAKYTGVSAKSLRYYEQLNILKPAYTDQTTGYRYYSLEQQGLVGLIWACIELDIPLKEFARFTDDDDVMNLRTFLEEGRERAEKKLDSVKRSLNLVKSVQKKVDLYELYEPGKVYTREVEEKVLYVMSCGTSLDDIDELELVKSFYDLPFAEDIYSLLLEYGSLCEFNGTESALSTEYSAFMELPMHMKNESNKTLPGGTYFCCQGDRGQLEQAAEVFKEQLRGRSPFLAIETEIFTGTYKINKPNYELRLIVPQ